ncbi:DUF2784 domain-containing protein [Actinosynnema pretiosum subsp. pretiosum]|uniref:DUF2784 domain-containing protein n=1 Tax=Actinosynnema pretiosum subsp. pretiosum TaxID=103721 RepID=A0AA45L2Q4_9PSEU|nr:putative membrane protein [Actinosynnema pretiosum subsp. pretiosum]QUF02048.1 DUF2784 domain-containing protein [Actinosynnema pretiosum subsp. pretiosum]
MVALALAELVVVLHYAALVFLVVGGFLARRWRWLVYPHVAMAAWGLSVVVFALDCPLTMLENELRVLGGEPPLTRGFIDTYIDGVLYPESLATPVQVLVAVLVLGSWLSLAASRRSAAPSENAVGRSPS